MLHDGAMTIMPGPADKATMAHQFIYDKSTTFLLSTVWAAWHTGLARQITWQGRA
jgi:hypothetical protein